MRRHVHTLTEDDVGQGVIHKGTCPCCHQKIAPITVRDAIGRVQNKDVGKRVYLVDGVVQVESDDQVDERLRL